MTVDSVVTIRTIDYLAALTVSAEITVLLYAVGKGEIADRDAVAAARGLSLSLTRRMVAMKPGGPMLREA